MATTISEFLKRLKADPSDEEAFDQIEQYFDSRHMWRELYSLYRRSEGGWESPVARWQSLADRLQKLDANVDDRSERSQLLTTIGKIYEERLDRPDKAIPAYQQAWKVSPRDLSPEHLEPLERARALYIRGKSWEMVQRLLDLQRRVASTDQEIADVECARARFYLDHLDDSDRALDHARNALSRVNGHMGAASVIRDHANRGRDWEGEARRLLVDSYSDDGPEKAEKLRRYLRFLVREAPRGIGDPTMVFEELLEREPQSAEMWHLRREWLQRAESSDDAWSMLTDSLENVTDVETKRRGYQQLVDLAMETPIPDLRLLQLYEQINVLTPSDLDVVAQLDEAWSKEQRWDDVLGLYERAAETLSIRSFPISSVQRAASLAFNILGDATRAAQWYRRLRDMRPGDAEIVDFFVRHLSDDSSPRERYEAWVDYADNAPTADKRLEAYRNAAQLAEEALDMPDQAVEWYRTILDEDPENQVVRRRLMHLYRETERFNALADLLRVGLASTPESESSNRLKLLRDLDEVYAEKLGLGRDRIELLHEIVALDREDAHAYQALEQLLEKEQRWRELADIYERHARVLDSVERVEILKRYAWIREEKLHDAASAARTWRMIHSQSDDPLSALGELERIYRSERDATREISILWEIAQTVGDSDPRAIDSYARIAALASDQDELLEEEVDALKKLLALTDEQSHERSVRLESLYLEKGDWKRYADSLEARLGAEGVDGNVDDALRLAELFYDSLDEKERGAEIWRQVLAVDEHADVAIRSLTEHYARRSAWKALTEHAGTFGDGDRAFELMEASVQEQDNEAKRADLLGRMAKFAAQTLEDPDRTTLAWENLLSDAPNNLDAIRHLEPLYAETGDTHRQAQMIERMIELESPNGEPHDRRLELARLFARDLQDWSGAYRHYRTAWLADPSNEDLRSSAREAAKSAQMVENWLETLQSQMAALDDGPLKLALIREAGRVGANLTDRPEVAIKAFLSILDEVPADDEAIDRLEQIYTEHERWEELDALYGRAVEAATSPADRSRWQLARSRRRRDSLDDAEGAIELFAAYLDSYASDSDVHLEFAELLEREEEWEQLAIQLDELASTEIPADERSTHQLRRARVLLDKLDDAAGALAQAKVLLDPSVSSEERDDAEILIRQCVPADNVGEEATDLLVRHFEASQRWDELIDTLEESQRAHGDLRRAYLHQIADVQLHQLHHPSRTLETFGRLISVGQSTTADWDTMERVASDFGLHADLVEIWDKGAADLGAVPKEALYRRSAEVLEHPLQDFDRAIEFWRRINPPDSAAKSEVSGALERLHGLAGNYSELAALYLSNARSAEDPAAAKTPFEQAIATYREAADFSTALDVSIEATEIVPESTSLWDSRFWLHEKLGDITGLADAIESELELDLDEVRQATLEWRCARVLHDLLERPKDALEYYEAAFSHHADEPAHVLISRRLVNEIDDNEGKARAAHLLIEAASNQEQWQDFVFASRTLADTEPDRKFGHLISAAEVLSTRLDDPQAAFEMARQALKIEPTDDRVHSLLEAIAGETGEWQQLGRTWIQVAESDVSEDVRAEFHAKAAQIYADRVGERIGAAQQYALALELDSSRITWRRALVGLYEELEDWSDLTVQLDLLSKQVESDAERLEMMSRAADVAGEQLADVENAVSRWQAIESEVSDPQDPLRQRASQTIDRLLREGALWSDLALRYIEQANGVGNADEEQSLLLEAANIYDNELGDRDATFSLLWRLDKANGLPDSELERFADLARTQNEDAALVGILQRLAATSGSDGHEFTIERARVLHNQLGRHDESIEALRSLAVAELAESDTVSLIQSLATEELTRDDALQLLESVHREKRDAFSLFDVLEKRAERSQSVNERRVLFQELATIAHQELDAPLDAYRYAAIAWQLSDHPVEQLFDVRDYAEAASAWPDFATMLENAGQAVEGDSRRVILAEAARVYEEELSSSHDLQRVLEARLDAEPGNLTLADEMVNRYISSGEVDEAVSVLERVIRGEQLEDFERVATVRRLVALEMDNERFESARTNLEWLRDKAPDDLDDLDLLLDVYRYLGAYEDLEGGLQIASARRSARPVQSFALQVERASVLGESLLRYEEAIALWERLAADPIADGLEAVRDGLERLRNLVNDRDEIHRRVLTLLAPIHENFSEWRSYLDVMELLAPTLKAKPQAAAWERIAKVAIEQRGQTERAFDAKLRQFQLDPDSSQVREELLTFGANASRLNDVADTFERTCRDTSLTSAARKAVAQDLCSLYNEQLRQPEQGLAALELVVSLDIRDRSSVRRLAEIYQEREDWAKYKELVRNGREEISQHKERIEFLEESIRRLENKPETLKIRKELLEDLIRIDPDSVMAPRQLAAIYEKSGAWNEWRSLIRRQLRQTQDEALQARLRVELANTYVEEGTRIGDALDELRRVTSAGEYASLAEPILRRLVDSRDRDGVDSRHALVAAQMLEEIGESTGDERVLQAALETELRYAGSEAQKMAIFDQLIDYATSAGEMGRAAGYFEDALVVSSERRGLIGRLVTWAQEHDRREEAAQVLLAASRRQSNRESANEYQRAAADLLWNDGQHKEAARLWKRMLELEHDDAEVIGKLRGFVETSSDPGLAEFFWRYLREHAADAVERTEAGVELARVHLRQRRFKDVVDEVQALLSSDSIDRELAIEFALEASRRSVLADQMSELAVEHTRTTDAPLLRARALERRMELVEEGSAREKYRTELASILDEHLSDSGRAFNLRLEDVASGKVSGGELEKLVAIATMDDQKLRIVDALQRSAGSAQDTQERGFRLALAGRVLLEGLHEMVRGRQLLAAAITHDPNSTFANNVLEASYLDERDFEGLADHLVTRVLQPHSDEERFDLLRRVVAIYEGDLQEPERAYQVLVNVTDEQFPEAMRSERLRLGRMSAENPQLVDDLRREAAKEGDVELKIRLLLEAAELTVRLERDADAARARYGEVLALDPENLNAVEELLELERQEGHWAEAYELIDLLSPLVGDDGRESDLRLEQAVIAERNLDDGQKAAQAYEHLIALQPDENTHLEELRRLYRETRAWPKLSDLLVTLIAREPDMDEKHSLRIELAQLAIDELDDQALVDQQIEALRDENADDSALSAIESRVFRAKGQWEDAIDSLMGRIAKCSDARERATLLFELGQAELELSGDVEGSLALFEDALEGGLRTPELYNALEDAYRRLGKHSALIDINELRAENRKGPAAAALYTRIAAMYLEYVGSKERAFDATARAYRASPTTVEYLENYLEGLIANNQSGEAMEISRHALMETDDFDQGARRARILYWYSRTLLLSGEVGSALRHLEEAFALNPRHPQIALAVGSMRARDSRHVDALDALKVARMRADELTRSDNVQLHFLLGNTLQTVGDNAEARTMFEQVLSLAPDHKPALNAIRAL